MHLDYKYQLKILTHVSWLIKSSAKSGIFCWKSFLEVVLALET